MRSPLGVLTTRGAFPCAGNNEKRARGRERGERGKIVATYQIERSSESQHDLPLLFPRPPSRPTFAIHRFIAHTYVPPPLLPTSPPPHFLSFFHSLARSLSINQSYRRHPLDITGPFHPSCPSSLPAFCPTPPPTLINTLTNHPPEPSIKPMKPLKPISPSRSLWTRTQTSEQW